MAKNNNRTLTIILVLIILIIPCGFVIGGLYWLNKKKNNDSSDNNSENNSLNLPDEKDWSGNGYFPISYNPITHSDLVEDTQALLNKNCGYSLNVDGYFGIKTLNAAKEQFGHDYISLDDYKQIGGKTYAMWTKDYYDKQFNIA